MNARKLTIGKAAKLSGLSPKTIRYYEEARVLPEPERNLSGYRVYRDEDLRRMELVRRARVLDMPLLEVRNLVEYASTGTCNDFQDHFIDVVRNKLEEVDRQIADLQHLREDLQALESHLRDAEKEANPDHTMIQCSPEVCNCMGNESVCVHLTQSAAENPINFHPQS